MKPNPIKTLASIALLVLVTATTALFYSIQAAPLGTAFTYQGRLVDNGSPANGTYDLRFALFNALSAGSQIGIPITNAPTAVSNGLFTVTLDFGGGIFLGNARWLEIGVRTNGSVLAHTTLTPRQELTPTPNAIYADTAATANSVAPGSINNPALAVGAVNSSSILDGSINTSDLSTTVLSNTFWRLNGNAGTTPGVNFLGATDNQPLELHVNGQRALRVEPDVSGFSTPNIIGGSANFVTNGAYGATIGGGGGSLGPNSVTNSFGTVAGGVQNISGQQGAVGGGYLNTAGALNATVGGGYNNVNSGEGGTVGGGYNNSVSGTQATVPGGQNNSAAGNNSFAAGQNAKANHQGAFVWADSSGGDFASSANNQFLGRASYFGFNRTTPITGADVFDVHSPAGNGSYGGMYLDTTGAQGWPFYGYALAGAAVAWHYIDGTDTNKWKLYNGGVRLTVANDGKVGIGTTTPNSSLHVAGDTRIEGVTQIGSGTGTAEVPDKGIITRRVKATTFIAGDVVARTDKLTLERDGSNGGWRIVNVASPGYTTIAFTGLTSAGATVNFVTSLANPAVAATTIVFTDAQNVVSLRGTFGDSYLANHMTEVSLTRYPTDNYWTGTVTSTFNQ